MGDFGQPRVRNRYGLSLALLVVVISGLASRRFPHLLPVGLGKYPGDALWALMIYVGIAIINPRIKPLSLACVALAVCFAVEFSQLYQTGWINTLRAHWLGHLVLGSTFHWPDLLAYACGVGIAWLMDVGLMFALTAQRSR